MYLHFIPCKSVYKLHIFLINLENFLRKYTMMDNYSLFNTIDQVISAINTFDNVENLSRLKVFMYLLM